MGNVLPCTGRDKEETLKTQEREAKATKDFRDAAVAGLRTEAYNTAWDQQRNAAVSFLRSAIAADRAGQKNEVISLSMQASKVLKRRGKDVRLQLDYCVLQTRIYGVLAQAQADLKQFQHSIKSYQAALSHLDAVIAHSPATNKMKLLKSKILINLANMYKELGDFHEVCKKCRLAQSILLDCDCNEGRRLYTYCQSWSLAAEALPA